MLPRLSSCNQARQASAAHNPALFIRGTASPLLANVYLHYVLDLWADWWRNATREAT